MTEAKKMLYWAFSLLLTVSLIFAWFHIYKRAIDTTNKISGQQDETNRNIEEYPIMKFDGLDITGSQAISYIKEVVGNHKVPVTVKTSGNPSGFSVTDSSLYSEFRDLDSVYYINPVVQYTVAVERDENEVIIAVEITYVTP